MNKKSHVAALCLLLIVPWSASAGSAPAARPLRSNAQSAARAWTLGVFFQSAVASPCASPDCPQSSSQIKNTEEIPATAPKIGNALLQNLPTLFALNALFSGASNGLLALGAASLANIIILYRIFFTP